MKYIKKIKAYAWIYKKTSQVERRRGGRTLHIHKLGFRRKTLIKVKHDLLNPAKE
jgi:hypothetical protein